MCLSFLKIVIFRILKICSKIALFATHYGTNCVIKRSAPIANSCNYAVAGANRQC